MCLNICALEVMLKVDTTLDLDSTNINLKAIFCAKYNTSTKLLFTLHRDRRQVCDGYIQGLSAHIFTKNLFL